MSKNKNSATSSNKDLKAPSFNSKNPILSILFKVSIISIIILTGIFYSDHRGFFKPNNKNNHTDRKWTSFYKFSTEHKVDIILVGNSHLYTGINPKNLSSALGCNSFILASPGTNVIDHYYALKEAIRVNKPKLAIIETYGLSKCNPYEMKNSQMSDQFKSFYARKNSLSKILSTPFLFPLKAYPYALSNTLRNHSFLTTNYSQVESNIKNSKKKPSKKEKLYLGRYVRFQTGIEESTMQKYDSLGSPVDGLVYETNDYQDNYIKKIIDLCNENDVGLMFVTLPMFHQHISNYSIWKSKLAKSIGDKYSTDEYWFDMQIGKGYEKFSTASFENTYGKNQHMTYSGSLIATYKLVDFIHSKKSIKLPNRSKTSKWIKLFYADEGFFENNTISKKDTKNKVLYNSKSNIVSEILLIKQNKNWQIITKVKPKNEEQFKKLASQKARLNIQIKLKNGQVQNTDIVLNYDVYHSSSKHMNYTVGLKPIDILKVNSVAFTK